MVDEESVKKTLRAVLQSRSAISLSRLQTEYKEITGDTLPHKQLGHTTVDALLHSMPSVVQLDKTRSGEVSCNSGGDLFFLSLRQVCHLELLVSSYFWSLVQDERWDSDLVLNDAWLLIFIMWGEKKHSAYFTGMTWLINGHTKTFMYLILAWNGFLTFFWMYFHPKTYILWEYIVIMWSQVK